ncbi:MAG: phospholipase D family protein [Xanthomonadales bacterium]|nr:phospholipase D family protein [Xanthomonadales bacterium]
MRKPRTRSIVLLAVLLAWFASSVWQAYKPLPDGVGVAMPWRVADEVRFLSDRTFLDSAGVRRSEQAIFDHAFAMIGQAQRLVLLDMFLFNDFAGAEGHIHRALSGELTQALLKRMREVPSLRVVVITDPINTVYGSVDSAPLESLRAAGAQVVVTDLSALRASNPLWSGPWALCCAWLGNRRGGGWLPDPLAKEPITLRSWLALPNFRANHRKVLVVDKGEGWQALVTSANPHDASSAHDNVALQFSGAAALDLVASEAAVAKFSGTVLDALPILKPLARRADPGEAQVRVLTEAAIRSALLQMIDSAQAGDALDVAVFYLSDRGVVEALIAAQQRGVALRVLLDPNEDAFGRKKNGVPNRPVAGELVQAGIPVRWCDTHGEQCHAKFLYWHDRHDARLIVGSANFTRRNLADLNLETSLEFAAAIEHPAMQAANAWFDEVWSNEAGRHFSADYALYADTAWWHRAWYRVGETMGWSTW